ncbi:MAG: peptidase C39 [Geobacter sp.]|nr:MAG: peptidase C39 [Geobacter sp.]
MKRYAALKTGLLTFALTATVSQAEAGPVVVPGVSGSSFTVDKVTSLKEARYLSTIRQQYDFSCGSAALASLLTFHYQDTVTEQEVFIWMYKHGDQAKIRREGFSLLDMKRYLEANGYNADGFYVSLDQLAVAEAPAIVLINTKGYNHFVVVKGVTDKNVLVGDPSLGTRIIPREEFEKMWNGLVFIIRNRNILTTNNFNRMEEWRRVKEKAPLGLALRDSALANTTMLMSGPGGVGQ